MMLYFRKPEFICASLIQFTVALLFFATSGLAPAATLSDKEAAAELSRGVEIAREGHYDQGLEILQAVLEQTKNQYPVLRDIVIITTWKEDCPAALQAYEEIHNHPEQEAYLIAPVSRCLYEVGKEQEAFDKLQAGIKQWPGDKELQDLLTSLQSGPEPFVSSSFVNVAVGANQSDQGNQEWILETLYNKRFRADFLAYARFLTIRADDPNFDTGDLNRVGVGGRYDFLDKWAVDQEFSFDLKRSGESGSTTTLFYTLEPSWTFNLSYASFAEDLSLRAKAQLIDSDRISASVDFHTEDYLWTWAASTSLYDYSDGNDRNTFFTTGSYAYVLKTELEQRVSLELYRSTNTNIDTFYYNPIDDLTLTVSHVVDYVYDSKFKRHVDHFYVYIGSYSQKNQSSKSVWGLRFEQDYDFDDYNALNISFGFDERVYDGNRENQLAFYVNYRRNL